ncbi:unnamed protein product [Linum trigynum]|uniref:Uncharacterized protein n=1 Tax=Linum trigynum TaxID=586398 RepID=A0AAV2FT38_9ROSI
MKANKADLPPLISVSVVLLMIALVVVLPYSVAAIPFPRSGHHSETIDKVRILCRSYDASCPSTYCCTCGSILTPNCGICC